MIYFDGPTKSQIIKKIYDSLEDGGYFFISHSESVSHLELDFEYVQPSIYRKPLNSK